LTTLRTGATSAVATRRLKKPAPCVVSLLGSGAEAYAQLDAMRAAGYVSSARVFSPTEANRKRLAETFRTRHDMDIVDVPSAEASGRLDENQITLFKSVGTGIQDIALAAVIYERAKERHIGTDIGAFPYLKET